MWIFHEGSNPIRAFDLSTGARDTSRDTGTTSGTRANALSVVLNHTYIQMAMQQEVQGGPVLEAWRMSHGSAVTSRNFRPGITLSDNGDPKGDCIYW